jgi:hypothetical protein
MLVPAISMATGVVDEGGGDAASLLIRLKRIYNF